MPSFTKWITVLLALANASPLLLAEEKGNIPLAGLAAQYNRNPDETLGKIKPIARQFLEADTVEKILPLVRDRRKVEPKIRAYYEKGIIPAPGMNDLGSAASFTAEGFVGTEATTRDFETVDLAFIIQDGGIKVDWEGYVGWSGMKWERFMKEKPTDPVLFRVKLRQSDYYNFGFQDTSWQAFVMASPDEKHTLYGYLKPDSQMMKQSKGLIASNYYRAFITLRLKYPKAPQSDNQVLIDSFVSDGWVIGN